jgi:hypothetical protein
MERRDEAPKISALHMHLFDVVNRLRRSRQRSLAWACRVAGFTELEYMRVRSHVADDVEAFSFDFPQDSLRPSDPIFKKGKQ